MSRDISNAEQTRLSSANALKTLYQIIIGLAITMALPGTFIEQGSILGFKIFYKEHIITTLLFFIFIPTVCRFTHGASIHLDQIQKKGIKPLLDFTGFIIQGSLFFLMATSLDKPQSFWWFFCIMLFVDALWILVLWIIKYIDLKSTEKQWIFSDIILIVSFSLIRFIFNPTLLSSKFILFLSVIAWAAFFWDYIANYNFYFPEIKI